MGFQYQYPYFIWGLALIPLLFIFFLLQLRWKKKVRKNMGDPALVNELTKTYSPLFFLLRFVLIAVAVGLGVIALMNPRKPGPSDKLTRKGIDVMIALDVSKSMLAADLAPNRLERAKQMISRFMNALPDDRFGLVLFAGSAYLQMPITSDHGASQMYVSSAAPDAVPQQGTVLSEALKTSVKAFNPKERRYRAVVLISDGEDHDPDAVKTAEELAGQGVMINTVGVGSPEGSYIVDPETGQNKVDENGNVVISKLNEQTLQEIAQKTNGVYSRLNGSDETVTALSRQLSQIETKAYEDVSLMNFQSYYLWFAIPMLVLIILERLVPETKWKRR